MKRTRIALLLALMLCAALVMPAQAAQRKIGRAHV